MEKMTERARHRFAIFFNDYTCGIYDLSINFWECQTRNAEKLGAWVDRLLETVRERKSKS